jgi:hypothetical protein
MKLSHIGFVLFSAVLLYACSTDFDINAPRDETPVVFGLIDASADTNFIKITKTFQGDGNVLDFAQVRDSSEYKGKLKAYLKEVGTNDTLWLDTITVPNKEAGQFYSGPTTAYYTTSTLKESAEYEIVVNTPNKVASAVTNTVGEITVSRPRDRKVNLVTGNSAPWKFTNLDVEWRTTANAKLVEVSVEFEYEEFYSDQTSKYKTFEYFIGSKRATTDLGGETVEFSWDTENFFKELSKIPTPVNVTKRVIAKEGEELQIYAPINYKFTIAGDEIDTYLQLQTPSTGIVQERPKYTNVVNGLGIFSSRYVQNLLKDDKKLFLHDRTIEALTPAGGVSYVTDLKFE